MYDALDILGHVNAISGKATRDCRKLLELVIEATGNTSVADQLMSQLSARRLAEVCSLLRDTTLTHAAANRFEIEPAPTGGNGACKAHGLDMV